MANTLADLSDLAAYQGVDRLEQDWLDTAVAKVRAKAFWHIAPEVDETITDVYSAGGDRITLPSRRVVSVTSVTIGGTAYTGWELRPGPSLYLAGGWPEGYASVHLVHGYTTCPEDLLPVIWEWAWQVPQPRDRRVASISTPESSTTYFQAPTGDDVVRDYALIGMA